MKKKLSESQAISECKELWEEITASGLGKMEFFKTPSGGKWRLKGYISDCPLCEYAHANIEPSCSSCPLILKYGRGCYGLGFDPFNKPNNVWLDVMGRL